MTEPYYPDFPTAVAATYQQVVGACDPEDGTTTKEAFTEATALLMDRVNAGELVIDVEAAIRAELGRADDKQGRAADAVIKRIAEGQGSVALDGDPVLDFVVKLGGGKRKPWRHVTLNDLIEMDALRYKNYRSTQNAYDEWRSSFDIVRPALIQFSTVEAAVTAGAFDEIPGVAA